VRRLITSDCHIAAPYSVLDELPESYRQYNATKLFGLTVE